MDCGGQVKSSGLQMRCVFQKTSCFERCLLNSCKERECGKERMRRRVRGRERGREMLVWYVIRVESVLLFVSCSRDEGVIRILEYDDRINGGGIWEKDDLI